MKKNLPLTILCLLWGISIFSANQVVTNNNDSGDGSLRKAIADAGDGDEITFNLSSGNETITISSQLEITESLTIDGSNSSGSETAVTVQVTTPGTSTFRVFNINASGKTITISNMTIQGGSVSSDFGGGAIYHASGTMTLEKVIVSNSVTTDGYDGGGIYVYGGTLSINNSTITGNTAGTHGGGIYVNSSATACNITNSTINGNTAADGDGGGIDIHGTTTLTNLTIFGNSSTIGNGGGINFSQSGKTVTINSCTIGNNTVDMNESAYGGGIHLGNGTLDIKNTIIANNTDINITSTKTDYYYSGGTLTDNGYNFIENTNVAAGSGGFTNGTNNDVVGTDPTGLASSLSYEGGFSQVLSVSAGNLGSGSTSETTDQRGYYRISSAITRGAYQYGGVIAKIGTATSWAADGNYTTIAGAYNAASTGNTIELTGTAIWESGIVLDESKTVTIRRDDALSTTTYVQADYTPNTASDRVFNITAGTVTLENMTIRNGKTADDGGGINVSGTASLTINNCTISNNYADGAGGGINSESSGSINISYSTISDNTAGIGSGDNGGGIFFHNAGMTSVINYSTINGNTTTYWGGGIFYGLGNHQIMNSTISTNSQTNSEKGGGGIVSEGATATVTNCAIDGNTSTGVGGGFYADTGGTLTINNSTVRNNTSASDGGGVYFNGAGISSVISNSTINGNTSTAGWGGGLANLAGNYEINNSTIYGNAATSTSKGGGGLAAWTGTTTLSNVTLAGNTTGGKGGGVYIDTEGTSLTVKNSILGNNTGASGADYYYGGGGLTDGGYNIIEYANVAANSTNGFNEVTNILYNTKVNDGTTGNTSWNRNGANLPIQNLNISPSLANNGGPTQTLAISTGSLAITGGIYDASATEDQRGTTRFNPPTIGAYDYAGTAHTWTGSAKTNDWYTIGNWNEGTTPGGPDDVNIPTGLGNYPIIEPGEAISCDDLTIASGGELTLESDETGSGALITYGTVSGSATVEQYVTEDLWHFMGAPVAGATATIYEGNYLQTYDEADDTWTDIVETTTPLTPGVGYSLWGIAKATTFEFNGTPNSGPFATNYTHTQGGNPDHYGFNLMGNPYPSAIDWEQLRGDYGSIYYYDNGSFKTWNNGGAGSRFVPPMQGFLVAPGSAGTLSLENTDRTPINTASYYKKGNDRQYSILLATSGNGHTDKLYIDFLDNANEDFDLIYDAWKIKTEVEEFPMIYSFTGEQMLSIDRRPECDMIQLGFYCGKGGLYSISATQLNIETPAFLEDTKTNTFHDLTKGGYEFAWDISDNEKRFKLHLNTVGIEENQISESNILIYVPDSYRGNQQIFIKGAGAGKVLVSDMMGRVVHQHHINGTDLISIHVNLKTGIYMVSVTDGNNLKTEKIFIR